MTEREVAEFIDAQFRAHGCEGPSFTTIVSFGANAADPHHEPDDTVLKEGDCVLFDMGCVKSRYCSDMTRTWFCGQPTEKQAAVHDLVRRANEAAEALIKPGVRLCELDAAARDLITEAGYGAYFNHRLGHFIGQTDHEKGDVSSANTAVARPGMIFSIEPGVYLPGEFGVRVEDLVLVTETGCEVLNRNDKRLGWWVGPVKHSGRGRTCPARGLPSALCHGKAAGAYRMRPYGLRFRQREKTPRGASPHKKRRGGFHIRPCPFAARQTSAGAYRMRPYGVI